MTQRHNLLRNAIVVCDTVSAQKPWYAASLQLHISHLDWKRVACLNEKEKKKRRDGVRNKINLMSFCLLSMCSDCSRMTMTGHPLTTTHTPLWTNYYVSTLQNKRQRVGGLIQSNEKPALPDKPPGPPHSPRCEKWQPFVKPRIRRLGRHVTICLWCVHCGGPAARAKVSCIINSAYPWHCVWAVLSIFFSPFFCMHMRKKRKGRDQNGTSMWRKEELWQSDLHYWLWSKDPKNVKSRFSYLMRIRCDYTRGC